MSILKNEHGTWRIERVTSSRGYRWNLYYHWEGKWWHVANQGRRKTCVELANTGYQLSTVKGG